MEQNKNQEAWRLLDEASKINDPATKAETDKLENLLKQAREAADDPHEESFAHKHEDLTDVVSWSNERHKTWSWAIIGGALLGVLLLWCSKNKDVEQEKQKLEKVEAWNQPCDTVITYESCGEMNWLGMYDSPNKYKAHQLARAKYRVEGLKNDIAKADSMEYYAAHKEEYEKSLKEWEPRFDEINNMSFEELKEVRPDGFGGTIKIYYCEKCGEEIHFVPEFEPEVDDHISSVLNSVASEIALENENSAASVPENRSVFTRLSSDEDDFIEFDTMINIRPAQGNRLRSVEEADTRARIIEIVEEIVHA